MKSTKWENRKTLNIVAMTINNGCSKDDELCYIWKWTFVRTQRIDVVSTRASAKSKLSQRDMSKEPETCHPLFAILVSYVALG